MSVTTFDHQHVRERRIQKVAQGKAGGNMGG